jgi:hypothetical protein
MRALVRCLVTFLAVAVSGVLSNCAHGGTHETESASENELLIFRMSPSTGGIPSCPYESLGPIEAGYSRNDRELRSTARMRGGDAVIKVTRFRGPARDLVRGELIRFSDPDCRY